MKFLLVILLVAPFLALDVVAHDDADDHFEEAGDDDVAEDDGDTEAAEQDGDDDADAAERRRRPCCEGEDILDDIELPEPAIDCPCPCDFNPVCGTDGKTYSNLCVLKCVSKNNVKNGLPPIKVLSKGPCKHWPCHCPNTYKPVCGSDGVTYRNLCYLKCENRRRKYYGLKPIYVKYNGPCKPIIWCNCPNVVIPVCGSDGRTYRNMCYLLCASQLNVLYGRPPIYFKSKGPCKFENCNCPKCYAPVCANNKKTFANRCLFDCENKRRFALGLPLLYIRYNGPCH